MTTQRAAARLALAGVATVGVALLAATAAASPPPADGLVDLLTAANAEIIGPEANARVATVGGGGDLNGDGLDDAVAASASTAPLGRRNAGEVWVIAGRRAPADVDLAAPRGLTIGHIVGAREFDDLGRRAATVVGDLNGDGRADLAVGAPGADPNGRLSAGSVYVIFGRPDIGEIDLAVPDAGVIRIDGAAAGEGIGGAVAPAGDVNGDGSDDLLIGAFLSSNTPARAYVVFGGPGIASVDLAARGPRAARILKRPGVSSGGMDGVGDVNGDGLADLVLGDDDTAGGGVDVVLGGAGFADLDLAAPPPGREFRIQGPPDSNAGFAVAGAGDLDGDGLADLAIGAPGVSGQGAVFVVRGRASGADVDLSTAGARVTRVVPGTPRLGSRLAGVGDVNGDGRPDLAVGGLGADYLARDGAGSVTVLLGGTNFFARRVVRAAAGPRAIRIVGPRAGTVLGTVAAAGNTDGVGGAEIITSGQGASIKGRGASGGAWLYGYGATRPCAAVARPNRDALSSRPSPLTLSARQLLINQRIGQAAIRRVAAIERRLRAVLLSRDICAGTLSTASLAPGVTASDVPETPAAAAAPRPLDTSPSSPPGAGSTVRLTAAQLRTNQRIYIVALQRARELLAVMNGRLTGGNISRGALDADRFTPGLSLALGGAPAPSLDPATLEPDIPPRRPGAKVRLTFQQLEINQRIAQVAVRLSNDALAMHARGVVNANMRDGGIGADAFSGP